MQQIIIIFFFNFHLTQHVSALNGHLQVSETVETATMHQCALNHTRYSPYTILKSIKIPIKMFLIS
jgi:hypothetical protein